MQSTQLLITTHQIKALSFSISQKSKRRTREVNEQPRVTQLGSGKAGIGNQVWLTLKLTFLTTPHAAFGKKKVKGRKRGKDRTTEKVRQNHYWGFQRLHQ